MTSRSNSMAKSINGELNWAFFDLMVSGHKTIEGRLNVGKWATCNPDDVIIFKRKDPDGNLSMDIVVVKIISITRYSTFRELLTQEGLRRVFPGVSNIEDGINLYSTWYSISDQVSHGVLAIEVQIDH